MAIEEFSERSWRYFKQVRLGLRILLCVALSAFLLIDIVLVQIDELFPGAHGLGQVFSKLAASYVSGFIFYFLAVHWQRQTDKEHIQDHIGPHIYNIIVLAISMMRPITGPRQWEEEDGLDIFRLKRIEIISKLERYDIDTQLDESWVNGVPATIHSWIRYNVEQTKATIKEILVHYTLLDAALIRILNDLTVSNLMRQPEAFFNGMKPSFFGEDLWTYLRRVEVLFHYSNSYPGRKSHLPPLGESAARSMEHMGDLDTSEFVHDPNLLWKTRKLLRKINRAHRKGKK